MKETPSLPLPHIVIEPQVSELVHIEIPANQTRNYLEARKVAPDVRVTVSERRGDRTEFGMEVLGYFHGTEGVVMHAPSIVQLEKKKRFAYPSLIGRAVLCDMSVQERFNYVYRHELEHYIEHQENRERHVWRYEEAEAENKREALKFGIGVLATVTMLPEAVILAENMLPYVGATFSTAAGLGALYEAGDRRIKAWEYANTPSEQRAHKASLESNVELIQILPKHTIMPAFNSRK